MTIEEIDSEIKFCDIQISQIKLYINISYYANSNIQELKDKRIAYKYKLRSLKQQKLRLQKLNRILDEK
jgi:hypothetical protein